MDPMFGLPCVQDSRAMDSARTRNQSQEKLLAEKFESLDLDMKTRSSKLITQKNEIEDFLSSLDSSSPRQIQLPAGLTKRERAMYKKMAQCAGVSSIPLAEFDRLWKQKAFQARHNPTQVSAHASLAIREPGIQTSQDARRATRLRPFEMQDNKEEDMAGKASLVVSEGIELCLPMNRQKHAVRDVWSRITSEDMRHKTALKKIASSVSVASHYHYQQGTKGVARSEKTDKPQGYQAQSIKPFSDQNPKRP
ncbi:hypothetical protein ElyMa_001924200 [Elysia marginata]|uniref:Uncharacterized protein n=1 Tax=Elysia marginata TaxID=1093978 RepID=A0AAV4EV46_9GAST|nr:hypothetical protein ElyMa_001924200 [Elysia marginata]